MTTSAVKLPSNALTDRQYADTIRSAADVLRKAVAQAVQAGLSVKFDEAVLAELNDHDGMNNPEFPRNYIRITRPL